MKSTLITFLFCFLFICADAAHIIGGDFSYKCVGSGQYEFTLTMYRDCSGKGGQFDSFGGSNIQASITIYEEGNSMPVQQFELGAPIVDELNVEEANPCIDVPPNICVQQGVYSFSRDIPISNNKYTVVYQRCCRNGTITNIFDPGQTGMTFALELLPTAQTVCNSSPEFVDFPPPLICTNEPMNFDHSAFDADGDQLVYEFCTPLSGGSVDIVAPNPEPPPPYIPVNFMVPDFSFTNPVGGSPQVVIDPVTGFITGTPNLDGQYVVGVCVSEFRNGVLLSRVQRDFQFNITPCEPIVNAGIQGFPNANVANIELDLCGTKDVVIINQSTDENFISEYLWEVDVPNGNNLFFNTRDVAFTLPEFGAYSGTLVLNPNSQCSDSLTFTINSAPEVLVDFTASYDTCEVGPVQYVDLSPLRPDFPIVEWIWELDEGIVSNEQYPAADYQTSGTKNITLSLRDTVGCEAVINGEIIWQPAPEIIIIEPGDFKVCPESYISFKDNSFPVDDTYTLNWTFGDGNEGSGLVTGNLYQDPGTYDVTLEITSPIGCMATQEFRNLIDVDSFPVADFYWELEEDFNILNSDIYLFEDSKRAIGWDWLVPVGDPLEGPEAMYTFRDTGLQTIGLVVEHLYGCYDTLYRQIDVAPVSSFYVPNALTPNGDGKNEFWRPNGLFIDQLEFFEVHIYNRWGQELFMSSDASTGWNGRSKDGRLVPTGGYVYSLSYKAPRKEMVNLSGTIMVIY